MYAHPVQEGTWRPAKVQNYRFRLKRTRDNSEIVKVCPATSISLYFFTLYLNNLGTILSKNSESVNLS